MSSIYFVMQLIHLNTFKLKLKTEPQNNPGNNVNNITFVTEKNTNSHSSVLIDNYPMADRVTHLSPTSND